MKEFSNRCITELVNFQSTGNANREDFEKGISLKCMQRLNEKYIFHQAIDPHKKLRDLCRLS